MITHVVFDFDGTLADSREVLVRLYNELAARNGYGQLTAGNLDELRRLTILERCSRLGVPPYRLPFLGMQLIRSLRGTMTSVPFNEGIPELLEELRGRGLKLFILSSNSEENIRAFLAQHSAGAWVDGIHSGSSLFGKARRLRALMRKAGLRPEQLVYVGDELRDVQACREAGVRAIAVLWGADAEELLRAGSPDAIAARPAEIAGWLARWSAVTPDA